jgi:hypothetical protein
MIIWMCLEPKHKNFKDEYKIKERVKKKFNIRRHMSILVVFEWYFFEEFLNWGHILFKGWFTRLKTKQKVELKISQTKNYFYYT